jgi:hypothetical protein
MSHINLKEAYLQVISESYDVVYAVVEFDGKSHNVDMVFSSKEAAQKYINEFKPEDRQFFEIQKTNFAE